MDRHIRTRSLALAAAVTLAAILGLAALVQWSKPELARWHTVAFEHELEAADADELEWREYLELEDELFHELDERVVQPSAADANPAWNRFAPGGANNPADFPRNWNRSFELATPSPVGGALLIHGLTDSPYSLRATAEILHRLGRHVVGLRLPGHGTAPSAMRTADVEDWRAAVRLAYRHLVRSVGHDQQILVVGYSNGGALALDLALASLDDERLRPPDGIVLYSPAIGITRAAALARLHRWVSWMPWFSSVGWGAVEPELDPYKYSSFHNNAGYQTHRLTTSVRARLARIDSRRMAESLPPVLTFMSLADATVLVEAVVDGLYDRLAGDNNELVIFDINRDAKMRDLFRTDPADRLRSLTGRASTPFRLTVISNVDAATPALEEWSRAPNATEITVAPTELEWPRGFFSLSHVAIPFPPDDPVYGFLPPSGPSSGIPLGRLEPRGERGLLAISPGQLDRLRSNPFFGYIERRLVELASQG